MNNPNINQMLKNSNYKYIICDEHHKDFGKRCAIDREVDKNGYIIVRTVEDQIGDIPRVRNTFVAKDQIKLFRDDKLDLL